MTTITRPALHIITGDCRKVDLGGPHDLVVADPPYGDTSLKWDVVCSDWIPSVSQALKPAASIWVFGSMR